MISKAGPRTQEEQRMTTAINTFDMTKASAKIGKLHCDKLVVANGLAAKDDGWKTYTPTLTGAVLHASDVQGWRYKIVGTTLFVRGHYAHSANAGTSTAGYTISLPSGCIPLAFVGAGNGQACGQAMFSGAGFQTVGVCYVSTTGVFEVFISTGAGTAAAWGNSTHADIRFSIGTTFNASFNLQVELSTVSSTILEGTF